MNPTSDPRRWWSLAVLLTAAFMVALDMFIVNVSLPSIQLSLATDFGQLQFIVAGYVLSYAVLLITGGRLGDLFGRKKMFLVGVAGFVLTSAWCGFSGSASMLIAARVLQGISAAALMPQVLSLIQVIFPVEERGKALGLFGAVLGVGGICGQIIGGLLLQANWWGMEWRLVFLVNLPVGILSLLFAAGMLKESYAPERKRLDTAGVGFVSVGLALLVYPLVVGLENDWPLWVYASWALSLIVLTLFVRFENRLLRRGRAPLMPTTLFEAASFRYGMLIALVFYSGNAALYFMFSVFLQAGMGIEPLHTAYMFIPLGVGYFLASLLTPRLQKRFGLRVLQFGTVGMAVGYTALIMVVDNASIEWMHMFVPLLLAGAGQGAVASPLIHTVLAGVRGPHAGAASGVLSTFTQVASAMGVAGIGTLFQSLLTRYTATQPPKAAYAHTMQWSLALVIGLTALTWLLITALMRARNRAAARSGESSPAASSALTEGQVFPAID